MIEPIQLPCRFLSLCRALAADPYTVLLDSSMVHPSLGRYSILAFDPTEIIAGNNLNDWQRLKEIYQEHQHDKSESLPFISGLIGAIGYDFGLNFENIKSRHAGTSLPGFAFGHYEGALIVDHQQQQAFVVGRDRDNVHRIQQKILAIDASDDQASEEVHANVAFMVEQQDYELKVKQALNYISQGDIYQVNLAHQCTLKSSQTLTSANIFQQYIQLRQSSPSGFGSFFNGDEYYILSSSPERFLHIEGDVIHSRPMKGTRPRGNNDDEDQILKNELLSSKKDEAELLMITDLLRNDLGRVCKFGSVHVKELRALEEYQTVYQTTSTVQGTLQENITPIDVLEKTFPGGSITGCPKIRSMKIIDALEDNARGFYTGSLGYIDFSGKMDMNILIRTLMIQDDKIMFHVGGGIVADSVPANEYEETMVKAQGMMQALGVNHG